MRGGLYSVKINGKLITEAVRSVKRALTLIVLLPCILCFRVIRR